MHHPTQEATMNLKLQLIGLATSVALFALPAAHALAATRSWY
jgi:hypothetical protein